LQRQRGELEIGDWRLEFEFGSLSLGVSVCSLGPPAPASAAFTQHHQQLAPISTCKPESTTAGSQAVPRTCELAHALQHHLVLHHQLARGAHAQRLRQIQATEQADERGADSADQQLALRVKHTACLQQQQRNHRANQLPAVCPPAAPAAACPPAPACPA